MIVRTDDPTAPFLRYACPETHAPLEVVDRDHLKSVGRDRAYPIRNGVPNFCKYAPSEDSTTLTKLRELVQVCQTQGWAEALRKVDYESLRYVLNEDRTQYIELLPLTQSSYVLEIGASKGHHT